MLDGGSVVLAGPHRDCVREQRMRGVLVLCATLLALLLAACDSPPPTAPEPISGQHARRCQERAIRQTDGDRSVTNPPGDNSMVFEECMTNLGYQCRQAAAFEAGPSDRRCVQNDLVVYNPFSW